MKWSQYSFSLWYHKVWFSGMIFNKQLFGKISFVKIIVRTEKYLVEYAFFGKIIISDIFFR